MGRKRDKLHKKGTEWVEWLRDEPVPPPTRSESRPAHSAKPAEPVIHRVPSNGSARDRLRHAGTSSQPTRLSTPSNGTNTNTAAAPTVSISINVPKFNLPKVKLPTLRQVRYWGVFAVVVVSLSVGSRSLLGLVTKGKSKPTVMGASTSSSKPSFSPAVPGDKKDLAKANGTTSKYVPDRQVYTYVDSLLNSKITVSEQQLPDNIKKDPSLLSKLAASIGATGKVDTAFGTAYVATSENGTSQRVVFVRQDLLIFIETVKKYDNDAWKLYIESLR